MTPAEIKAHLDTTAKANAAELERTRRAAFNARNDERRRAGLPEYRTMDEWAKDEAARRSRPVVRKK
jgi:hypothetical protein